MHPLNYQIPIFISCPTTVGRAWDKWWRLKTSHKEEVDSSPLLHALHRRSGNEACWPVLCGWKESTYGRWSLAASQRALQILPMNDQVQWRLLGSPCQTSSASRLSSSPGQQCINSVKDNIYAMALGTLMKDMEQVWFCQLPEGLVVPFQLMDPFIDDGCWWLWNLFSWRNILLQLARAALLVLRSDPSSLVSAQGKGPSGWPRQWWPSG